MINKDNKTCSICSASIHWLEVFPGNRCFACYKKEEDKKPITMPDFIATIGEGVSK